MIELKNVSHIYKSKKGGEVVALSDVNLTFADNGIYFLTGKSGSGKSTMLNLLSGIDFLQKGEITVDGQPMSSFKAIDYNNYRNNYAGIIFQEFNLIENMTVFENIDMPLKLQGKTDNSDVIKECLKKVDLEGYENRFPSELSGGQRQRVTIARQLAKGSRIILADEPTGSLDSENGKNIFELLKALSKDTLIVVASHDLDFANTYGDAMITFVDGKVTDVQLKEISPATSRPQKLKKTKTKFPNKYAVKMAFKDIFCSKVRFAIAVVLCFVSLAMFGMFFTISSFNAEGAIANSLANRNDKFISAGVSKWNGDKGEVADISADPFSPGQLNYIASQFETSDYIKRALVQDRFRVDDNREKEEEPSRLDGGNNSIAVIDSPDDIKLYGYELASGYLPLTDDSVYITDYYAYVIILADYCYFDNGQCVPIGEDAAIDSLVGKTIVKDEYSDQSITVAGIIRTDYERFMPNLADYEDNDDEYVEYRYLCNTVYTTLFATQGYVNSLRSCIKLQDGVNQHYRLQLDGQSRSVYRIYNDMSEINSADDCVVLYKDSYTTEFDKIKLGEHQVIVPLKVYNAIFDEYNELHYYCSFLEGIKVYNYPTHIGEKVKMEFFDAADGVKICDVGEVEIVGLLCGDEYYEGNIYLGQDDFNLLLESTTPYNRIDFAVKGNKAYMKNSFAGLRSERILMEHCYTSGIYNIEGSFDSFNLIFVIVGSILLVFSVVIFANFTSVAILNRTKDIGIIRAIGGSESNVFKIFFVEGLIFVIIVSVLAVIVSLALALITNAILVKELLSGVVLLVFNPWNIAIIPVACFVVMMISTFYPIRRISKRSPVDIIRNSY